MPLETSLKSRRPTERHPGTSAREAHWVRVDRKGAPNPQENEKGTNMPRRTRTEDTATNTPDEVLTDDGGGDTQSKQTSSAASSVAGGVVDSAKQAANQAKEATG